MSDDIDAFFNRDIPFVRKQISGGTTNGRIKIDTPKKPSRSDEFASTSKYAEPHVAENQQQLMNRFNDLNLNEWEEDDTMDRLNMDYIYNKYDFKQPTSRYPITFYKDRIMSEIKTNSFVVLEGPTACGKTTQVPQYILDDAYRERRNCNIIVAQPRRIAAASNAERVAGERDWPLGTLVGYQIGFDEKKHLSNDTRILFCTTGILLEKLIRTKHFHNYTHIILDEVHERNKDMDFLFVVIKKLFVSIVPTPKVKIVIMSATIEANRFSRYFAFPKQGIMQPAPIITIQHENRFRVKEFYLETFYKAAPKIEYSDIDKTSQTISAVLYKIAVYLIHRFDEIDEKELIEEHRTDERPTVLVFLPGIHEITRLENSLNEQWNNVNERRTKIVTIILHSSSDSQQRKMAFSKVAPRTRKIILATNIAESSITVPDVKYVLDFCRTRIMKTDTLTNFSSLQLTWAARSNCKQRAGRSGRVCNGRCYRFVEKKFYETDMVEHAIPELVSSPLENVILKAKLLEMGSPESILALAMDHPSLSDIANTILVLKENGALLRTCDGKPNDVDGDISFIGRIMANLPIDVKIAKLIILGYCFSILDECIIIGAALNSRNIFRDIYRARDNLRLYSQQLRWANSSGSDLFAVLHAYNTWTYARRNGLFGRTKKPNEREWANKFCLDIDALHECEIQINEIKSRLERMKIKAGQGVNNVQWNDNEKSIILKVVISGAFYPNYFTRSSINSDEYTRTAFQSIGARDPRNTIYYTGFDREHLRYLYKKPIKNVFIENGVVSSEMAKCIHVNFDAGSNKTFVTFKYDENVDYRYENGNELMPGKICPEVYKSLKMRDLRIPTEFWIMKTRSDEIKYAEENNIPIPQEYDDQSIPIHQQNLNALCLPRILDAKMNGVITHANQLRIDDILMHPMRFVFLLCCGFKGNELFTLLDALIYRQSVSASLVGSDKTIESCNQFWFQPENEIDKVLEFETYVRNYRKDVLEPIQRSEQLFVGKLVIVEIDTCAAPKYNRAKIMSENFVNGVCRVRLVDSGKIIDKNLANVYEYCGEQRQFFDLPPRCFECSLAQIQPSLIRYPNGHWPIEATKLFVDETRHKNIEIQIYSVTNGKANVFVCCPNTSNTINNKLICEHFGEFVEEDYISKYNHLIRKSRQDDCTNDDNFIDPMVKDYFNDENGIDEVEPPPIPECKIKLKLKGPYSSLSVAMHGLTEATRIAKVAIDKHSINSVILENDPQDITEKHLIAATVCYTDPSKKNINLRSTTQMPNIRGFGPLMALIFCPTMQVKRNKEWTHYTAIRTGLGYHNEKNRPVFEEHDMVFNLNVEITQHDIELVNQIRYCLDTLLLTYPGQDEARHLSENSKRHIQLKIKKLIVELLERPRQCINIENSIFEWNPHFADTPGYTASKAISLYGDRAIFTMHNTLKTRSQLDTDQNLMRIHCNELYDSSEIFTTLPRPALCRLCNVKLDSISTLKMHLLSRQHQDNENRIDFKRK